MDNSVLPRLLAPKPSYTAGRNVFIYENRLTGIPNSDAPNVLAKSYTIDADIEVPKTGGDGMIVTDGGRFGGYGFYLAQGKPVFCYNLLGFERFQWSGATALTEGKHTLSFDFVYDGPGFGKGGTGTLSIDGKVIDTKKIPHTIPFVMTIDESFDIGSDTRSGVNEDYKLPFVFTGKIDKITFNLKPASPAEEKALQEKTQETKNNSQ
jgi:hypothetical protein